MKNIKTLRKMRSTMKVMVGIAPLILLIIGSGTPTPVLSQEKIIKIDGSSTVYPITEAVAEEFQKAKRGTVKVTVGIKRIQSLLEINRRLHHGTIWVKHIIY